MRFLLSTCSLIVDLNDVQIILLSLAAQSPAQFCCCYRMMNQLITTMIVIIIMVHVAPFNGVDAATSFDLKEHVQYHKYMAFRSQPAIDTSAPPTET
jgi:hypothetical protein